LECALGSRRGRLGRGLRLRDLHSPAKNVFRESGLQSMACHGEIEDLCSSQHGGPDGHVSTTREPQSNSPCIATTLHMLENSIFLHSSMRSARQYGQKEMSCPEWGFVP
jgi:hypothetical protein